MKLLVWLCLALEIYDPHLRSSQVIILLTADTLNCVFDIWWIYDVLVNHFGMSISTPSVVPLTFPSARRS